PHLSIGKVEKLHHIYTNVNQQSIFSLNPFVTRKKGSREFVSINFLNTLIQFLKKKRTFGESKNLRKTIRKNFPPQEFELAKNLAKDIVVTVSNLTKNQVEYKSINDCTYDEFCDWVWISCNYVPFMSLVTKNNCEYADGGFGCLVPIREAVKRGATEIDAIILESENMEFNKVLGKNPFSLMVNLFGFMWDQVRYHNVMEGQLAAINKDVVLNLYYTPSRLTENSLIFNKKLMTEWWQQGFEYAAEKYRQLQENELRVQDE
ncbi:MAG TPA: patatin-like phospholipase family protein, partial [Flavobacteriaceae bacterium]|nr:patatin-like phospholipase family protein [Flavobacteriaceae bacterium]